MTPVRTVAPADALLTVDEVRKQARIDFADDDLTILRLIRSVTATLDGWGGILGRCLITQTWAQSFPAFEGVLRLPLSPVQSASVSYFDTDGVAQELEGAYRLHADPRGPYLRRIDGAAFPATADREDAVTVTMVCGYGDRAADVPEDIRHAAVLMVAHFYEHREAVGPVQFYELPIGSKWMLERYRRAGV